MNEKKRLWLDNASRRGGSFVSTFARACFCADDDNFKLMEPVLDSMMIKYPTYGIAEVRLPNRGLDDGPPNSIITG